jgi:hypothetical protein
MHQLGGKYCTVFSLSWGTYEIIVRLIKMRVSETYSIISICKHWSNAFPIHIGQKRGDAYNTQLARFRKTGETEIEWDASVSDLCRRCKSTGGNINTIKESIEAVIDASKETGLQVNRK